MALNLGGGLINPLSYFPQTFAEAQARFQNSLQQVQETWPAAALHSRAVGAEEELAMRWIEAEALETPRRRLLISSGQHGIEGYVGAAVLLFFIDKFLPRLDPRQTSLLLLHPINPWGMKNLRRTNAHNVDLNRNCVRSEEELSQEVNPDYSLLDSLLNPDRPLSSLLRADLRLLAGLARRLPSLGQPRFQKAALLGQFRFPRGIYYGGSSLQEENRILQNLLRQQLSGCDRVVHIDLHTGYGPRRVMNVICSPLEQRSSGELARRFDYPNVLKANPDEFYSIHGDLIDYLYRTARQEFPTLDLFSAAFEFGTLGSSLPALVRSLRASVYENQIFWHGSQDERIRASVEKEYRELFYPADPGWRIQALKNAAAAFEGILTAEKFI